MSLRPAQELVQESSKFSLRQFFESQAAQAIRSPAELPTEGFPTLNAQPDPVSAPLLQLPQQQNSPPSAFVAPHLRPQTPVEGRPPIIGAPPPKDGKFTFTGLMPVTTPIQMQHKILQQHQQQALSQAAASAKPTGLHSDGGNDVMRLKAHVVSLAVLSTRAAVSLIGGTPRSRTYASAPPGRPPRKPSCRSPADTSRASASCPWRLGCGQPSWIKSSGQ